MKVFVTGANGRLGQDMLSELAKRGHDVIGSGKNAEYLPDHYDPVGRNIPYIHLDITDAEAVKKTISEIRPDAVVHCAAWTDVDRAEEEENKAMVRLINAGGTANIAGAVRACGAKLLYLSTDYVFSGKGSDPWEPDSKDLAPLNHYGQTKLEGEAVISGTLERFFIVRTSWLFGLYGSNFVRTMLRAGKDRGSVTVVDDQIGTPTYTKDLARLLTDMIETDRYGYYHVTNSEEKPGGYISRADLAEEIYRIAGFSTEVRRISTYEYGGKGASRPLNSRLDKSKLIGQGFTPLPSWKDALRRYFAESKSEEFLNGTDNC